MTEDRPRIWIQRNYASLNGLRGVAAFMIFWTHFLWLTPLMQLVDLRFFGFTGVDLFFVLSGFLITGILYDSLGDPGYFRNFYIRRALRIFPLFYGMYLVIFAAKPFLHLVTDRYMPAFVLYVGNLVPAFAHRDVGHMNDVSVFVHGRMLTVVSLGHLWSLCVEEQFYLVWPAIVWMVPDRVRLMRLCVAGAFVALVLRVLLQHKFPILAEQTAFIYYATYTRFDTLLVGAWLALLLRGNSLSRQQLHRSSIGLIAVPGTIALVGGCVHFSRYEFQASPFTQTIGYSLIALAAAGLLMLSLDDESQLSSLLRFKPLARLGIVSYGFYVIHGVPEFFLHTIAGSGSTIQQSHMLRMVVPVVWFCVAWGLAEVSFRFYEQPFLRLKKVFAPKKERILVDVTEPITNVS